MEKDDDLTPFEGKEIRRVWHGEQWYFSVVDIIEILTDSSQPSRYWADVKKRSKKESNQSFDFCERLKLLRPDGKKYPTDCANTEGVFRIIQSVSSPKAEPFKLWLASLGKQAIDEAENPELLTKRQDELYRAKGYPEDWIKERIQSITTRNELTEEWKNRGVKEGQEYSILTATIAQGTFGLKPNEHAQLKGLSKENLRDHMTRFELILTSLSEEVTRSLTVDNDARGFNENLDAAVKGGEVGGIARQNVERVTGKPVVSPQNFLGLTGDDKSNELPPNNKTD